MKMKLEPILTLTIPGKPIPLSRARKGQKGFYDPQYQAKKNFAWEVERQRENKCLYEGPLLLEVTINMKMPNQWSKKKKAEYEGKPHAIRPDSSNYLKFVEDALHGVLWKDDCILSDVVCKKRWRSHEGSTEIKVSKIYIE